MHSNWSALQAQLLRSVNRRSAHIHLQDIIRRSHGFPAVRSPGALLDGFHDPKGCWETKNTALHALVEAARADGPSGETSTELLVLALWPGLDAVRHRLRRRYRPDLIELEADLLARLTLGIRTLDLARVNRIAATLLRNLERDVGRDLIAAAKRAREAVDPDFIAGLAASEPDDDIAGLMRATSKALGPDGRLLVAVHVGGWSQKEIAEALGISHAAARKRTQRARKRLMSDRDARSQGDIAGLDALLCRRPSSG